MAPDVYAFVVKHEQTSEYFFWSIKINPVSMSDMVIVLHKLGGVLELSYKMLVIWFKITRLIGW